MALETLLQEMKGIKGYLASGIMAYTGDLLAGDTTNNIDLGLVGATFNDIFRSAHEVCEKIGLEATREMVLFTPRGIVIMLCTGKKEKVHAHLISILTNDGNQALAKLTMEKLAPLVTKELG